MTRTSHNPTNIQAKRSSSETLIKRSAPDADQNAVRIDGTKIFPVLISDLLTDGNKVRFRAPGDSMYPTIRDGDEITVAPIDAASITIGDIILYRHKSGITAHRVMHIIEPSEENAPSAPKDPQDRSSSETLQFFLRGDAAIVFDDPIRANQILGKVTLVERQGRHINPYSISVKISFQARRLAARLKSLVYF